MNDGTAITDGVKQWTKLDAEGRKKHYFDNLAKIAETPVPQLLDKVLPPEFKRYTWEQTDCPRGDKGVFYNTMDGEQGAGDGTIYQWFKAAETGEVFRVPYFQGKFSGLTEVFLAIMAKSKELSPWSQVDSLVMEGRDLDFQDKQTRFGLVGKSAVIQRAGLENTVAALVSDEYSQAERWEIMMDRVAQISHESVHLNNQDTFMAMGNYRTIVEIGPEIIEMLCFAHNGCPPMADLQDLMANLSKGEFVNLDPYQEAVGMGVLLLARELNPEIKLTSREQALRVLEEYRDKISQSDSGALVEMRGFATRFALSQDNTAIADRLIALGVVDNRKGIFEQLFNNVEWVREKIDPDHTLPEVGLTISPDNVPVRGTLVYTKYDVLHEGKVIGEITINTDKKARTCWTNRVNIDEDYRGKGRGFGMATYVSAIEMSLAEGNTFRTHDWSQTEGAKHVWDILAEKGVADVIEPFTPDHTGRFNGVSEVRPRK